jgi:hypothetical protein
MEVLLNENCKDYFVKFISREYKEVKVNFNNINKSLLRITISFRRRVRRISSYFKDLHPCLVQILPRILCIRIVLLHTTSYVNVFQFSSVWRR